MNDVVVQRQYFSDSINELASALSKAQGEIKHATKEIDNSFFKSKYADLSACVDVAKMPLSRNGLSIVQIPDFDKEGVWMITLLMHSSGQWMRSYYPVKPVKNDPQGLGSAITYARRYAYCAMTGVVASGEDDDGNEASGKKETASSAKKRFEAILEAISVSDDPAITWGHYLVEINGFLDKDREFYDQLVKAGAKRKQELHQDAAMNAGMPNGFKDIRQ